MINLFFLSLPRTISLYLVLTLGAGLLRAQSTCEVWQWEGMDSASKILARTDVHNEHGLMVRSSYTGLRTPKHMIPDQVNISTYQDTLETTWTCAISGGDSMRFMYEYNEAGKRIQESEFRFTHAEADTGTTGMFSFTNANPDTNEGKWRLLSTGMYTYDRQGRKLQFLELSPEGKESQKHKWTYDKKDRIVTQEYFISGRMYRKDEYKYFSKGYSVTSILYDDKGTARHKLSPDSARYRPRTTTTYILDDQDRKIKILETDQEKKQISRRVLAYDLTGRPSREVYYDGENKVLLTHVYVYK